MNTYQIHIKDESSKKITVLWDVTGSSSIDSKDGYFYFALFLEKLN